MLTCHRNSSAKFFTSASVPTLTMRPVEMLIRLANYYDISVDYLVGRTDKKEMNK